MVIVVVAAVVYLFSICLPIYLPTYLSIYLQDWKRSLKTKLFCETSSIFELDTIQNEAMQLQSPINCESTTIPTVSIAGGFSRMQHYFAQRIVKTLLHITVFRDMAWARAYSGGFKIADQSRTNRGFHRHFLKLNFSSGLLVGHWTLLLWFFSAIFYHYWTQCLGRPEYSIRLTCNMIIMPYAY